MATLLSPGVYIEEVDASAIAPNVSANVAFLAGTFNDGPVDQPYIITNKAEYESVFGRPTDDNYNQWFQGYKFFDYANQLIVSRAYEESPETITSVVANPEKVFVFTGLLESGGTNTGGVAGRQVKATITTDFDYEVQIGDWVTFGTTDEVGKIWTIESLDDTATSGEVHTIISVEMTLDPSVAIPLLTDDDIWLQSQGHKNSGTQAYSRGTIDVDYKPAAENAAIAGINIDISGVSAVGDLEVENNNRLSYSYDLIKNAADFDYKYEQNELNTFLDGMKLKFFSKSPNETTIEIAIANWYDFLSVDSDNNNYAVAFSKVVGTTVENTMLRSLFDYNPQEDEIAIAINRSGEIETFIVSLDPLSVDGNGKNNYIETVLNENSKFVYVVDNSSVVDVPASYLVVDRFGWDVNTPGVIHPDGTNTTVLSLIGGRSPAITSASLRDSYFMVEDKERYEIDIVIGVEENPNIAIELADARKDCLAYVGARYIDTVGRKAYDAQNRIINYLATGDLTRTMFAAMFTNYFRIYDKYNKKYRWINVAGDMAGIRCDVTSQKASWWVSAGLNRGIIRNINKLAFTPSQEQRDNLYKAGVNPIVSFPGTGNLVWGNKTLHPIASSFDRINVRTLFNTIERSMSKAARSQVFEFNDPYTRNAILSMFNPYLATIKAGRGITDYLVICDETNNTPDVISRNELKVDIYVKPNYAAEMILLTFTNVGTRSFSDVVGV